MPQVSRNCVGNYQKILDRLPELPQAVNGLVSLWPKASHFEKHDMLVRMLQMFKYNGNCEHCVSALSSALKVSPDIGNEIKRIMKSITDIQALVSRAFNLEKLVDYIDANNVDVRIVNYAVRNDEKLKVRILRAQCDRDRKKEDLLIAKFMQVHSPHQGILEEEWIDVRTQEFRDKLIQAGNNYSSLNDADGGEPVENIVTYIEKHRHFKGTLLTPELIGYFISCEEIAAIIRDRIWGGL